jgi:hypothetical protein
VEVPQKPEHQLAGSLRGHLEAANHRQQAFTAPGPGSGSNTEHSLEYEQEPQSEVLLPRRERRKQEAVEGWGSCWNWAGKPGGKNGNLEPGHPCHCARGPRAMVWNGEASACLMLRSGLQGNSGGGISEVIRSWGTGRTADFNAFPETWVSSETMSALMGLD